MPNNSPTLPNASDAPDRVLVQTDNFHIPRDFGQYSTSFRARIQSSQMELRFINDLLIEYPDAIVQTLDEMHIINFKLQWEASKFVNENKDFTTLPQANTIKMDNINKCIDQDAILENMKKIATIPSGCLENFGSLQSNIIYLCGENVLPTTATVHHFPELNWHTDGGTDAKFKIVY
ncbi:unnamed protein product [Caenorhabditis angaria]|uniref:Uncharacterized protein n=1 Tax=Caenorhabditis angaria TaxID=860376 RepID=A0A9P1N356_9PELO|nr:unnamed protein product [Caenorhabditis angaria]